MPCALLQRKLPKFQEEPSDLETQLLELGFFCENPDDVGSASAGFAYNAHGSMVSMPHLSAMEWDFAEKLSHITRGTTEAYYSYDGNGIRSRKVVEKNGVVETRLYLGGFEIWRKSVNGVLDTERETLHVMDDKKRVALVETLTVENGNRAAPPVPVQRYQLDNHLGSASLELDDSACIISYEEYYPYGDTSYRAGRNVSEVSRKRYRYTGKEKDEESSLYYCEQRYYAAHISRWVSTDPTWLEDGINLYAYVHGNPVGMVDKDGEESEPSPDHNDRWLIMGYPVDSKCTFNCGKSMQENFESGKKRSQKQLEKTQIQSAKSGDQETPDVLDSVKYHDTIKKMEPKSKKEMIINSEEPNEKIKLLPAENTNSEQPFNEISMFSQVEKYEKQINKIAQNKKIDSELVKAIMHMETTHGYYDVIPSLFNLNKSILPMNINVKYWGDVFGSREELKKPEKNIEAGAEMIVRIKKLLPANASIEEIATLYNNINAKRISDYGMRVKAIYDKKLWENRNANKRK